MAIRLTHRDIEILHALTHSVRLFSVQQISRGWWNNPPDSSTAVRNRIRSLATAGWVRRAKVFAQPLPRMEHPLLSWRVADPTPCFNVLAWKSQSRWQHTPKSIPIIVASDKASRRLLGRPSRGLRQHFQTTHDLGVAEVFLRFREKRPSLIPNWRGERLIAHLRRGKKLPDAVIADDLLWPPKLVIEFAGAYSAHRLQQFHQVCVRERLSYELW